MKPGTYWAKGPDGWELFEVRAWAERLTAATFGWPAFEPLHEVQRVYAHWCRIEPPANDGLLH